MWPRSKSGWRIWNVHLDPRATRHPALLLHSSAESRLSPALHLLYIGSELLRQARCAPTPGPWHMSPLLLSLSPGPLYARLAPRVLPCNASSLAALI
jgi:hypothetical protein